VLTSKNPFYRVFQSGTTAPERDVDGRPVYPVDAPARRILKAFCLRKELESRDGRTRLGKYLNRVIPIAERYEADCEAARIPSPCGCH
jgi:hypothetical protein